MSADNGEQRWRALTPRTLDLAPPTAAPDSTHITYYTDNDTFLLDKSITYNNCFIIFTCKTIVPS